MIADISSAMKLKENLRKLLDERGITIAAAARKAGVSKSTLNDWANGSNPKDLNQVKKLCDAFNLTVDSLCFGATHKKSERSILTEYENEINAGTFEVILRRPKP